MGPRTAPFQCDSETRSDQLILGASRDPPSHPSADSRGVFHFAISWIDCWKYWPLVFSVNGNRCVSRGSKERCLQATTGN
jgi:hypothetical protein